MSGLFHKYVTKEFHCFHCSIGGITFVRKAQLQLMHIHLRSSLIMRVTSVLFCSVLLSTIIVPVSECSDAGLCSVWPNINKSKTEDCPCGYCVLQCKSGKTEIRNGFCVTFDEPTNHYYAGHCPFSYKENNTNRLFSVIPTDPERLNDSLCGPYNRKGLLCEECIDGYGPPVYSFSTKCANCSSMAMVSAIFLYLLLQFTPITLLFIFVIVFRLNITSGPLLGYVIFCQFYVSKTKLHFQVYDYMNSHMSTFSSFMLHMQLMLCECWNLNLLQPIVPPFCISEKLTNIQVLMLPFIPATYPVFLVAIICVVMEVHTWKVFSPFSKIWRKLFKNKLYLSTESVLQSFATLNFLSSTSNLYIGASLFKEVRVTYVHPSKNSSILQWKALFYDPTVAYYSREHLLYGVIALLLCAVLVVLPSLLLCLYPTRIYRYASQYISARKGLAITAFVEALHSCFKDGLNGTRDYRALAGVFVMLVPLSTLVAYIVSTTTHDKDLILPHVFFITSLLLSYVRPCKTTLANFSLSYHFTMTGVVLIVYHIWPCDMSVATEQLELILILIPLLSHTMVVIWMGYTLHPYMKRCFCRKCFFTFFFSVRQWFNRKCGHYEALPDSTAN